MCLQEYCGNQQDGWKAPVFSGTWVSAVYHSFPHSSTPDDIGLGRAWGWLHLGLRGCTPGCGEAAGWTSPCGGITHSLLERSHLQVFGCSSGVWAQDEEPIPALVLARKIHNNSENHLSQLILKSVFSMYLYGFLQFCLLCRPFLLLAQRCLGHTPLNYISQQTWSYKRKSDAERSFDYKVRLLDSTFYNPTDL